MKGEDKIREILITNTIRLVAEGGFEKATTKAITFSDNSCDVKMNEAYIYRLFESKEDLFDKAFDRLDEQFLYALRDTVTEIYAMQTSTEQKLYAVFIKTWRFMMKNETSFRYYIRYYYSAYFVGRALERHNRRFDVIINTLSPLFKEEADVCSIMHSVLTALLDFAVRVYNGDLEDSDINVPHIFNVLYCMMASYFKDEIKTDVKIHKLI